MGKKTLSKPMKEILSRLNEFEYIETIIFPEDIIVNVCRSTNLLPRVEENWIIKGTQQRPADLTLPGFPSGRDTLINIKVVNPLQQACVEEAAHTHMVGVAMTKGKERKRRTYMRRLQGHQIFYKGKHS